MKILFIILFLTYSLFSQDANFIDSIRLGYAIADSKNMSDIFTGNSERYKNKTTAINLDIGKLISKNFYNLPIDIYEKGGISYFLEKGSFDSKGRGPYDNFIEGNIYIKAYWKINDLFRLGFGEGISYASHIPIVEIDDTIDNNGKEEKRHKLINYLDISFDVRIDKVFSTKDVFLGYTLKHRSTAFGLYGASNGSNYNMLTIEKNF